MREALKEAREAGSPELIDITLDMIDFIVKNVSKQEIQWYRFFLFLLSPEPRGRPSLKPSAFLRSSPAFVRSERRWLSYRATQAVRAFPMSCQ